MVALSIDPWWTASALIGAPLLLLPALAMQRYIRRKTQQSREQASLRVTRLDEIFHGIAQVKLTRMEPYQTGRFAEILRRIVRAEVKSATGRAAMPALVDVVTGIGFFAVLMLGGREVAEGSRTTGEFMSFFTAMALTFQPIRRLSDLAGQWQIAATSLDRVYELFDTHSTLQRPTASLALPQDLPPRIEFRDVRFGYDETPVLRGLSFTAEAGKVTALVGASGAGKSTVFHLLTGQSDADAGEIRIDGVDVRQMTPHDQRALFASVSQEAALFDETLRENLILGRGGISADQLERALQDASVAEFLPRMAQGLDTPAGPRGSALSGGSGSAWRLRGRCWPMRRAAAGRGDKRAGCQFGNRGDGGAGAGARGADDAGDCASPVDRARCPQDRGAGRGPGGRRRHARGADGARRALCPAARAAIPRLGPFAAAGRCPISRSA